MLTEIRNRSSGVFAYVIAALIIIPMAFWGIQEYAGTSANIPVATVGDQQITQAAYRAQLSNQQQRMRQAMGNQVNNDFLNSDNFKQDVLQQMINRAVLEHVAAQQNYRISDEQLSEAIKDSDLFKTDGKFDSIAYEQYVLSTQQFSKATYETALRQDKILGQITAGYQESAVVLPDEIRFLLEIQAEKRSFDVLTVKQEGFIADVILSDEDIQAYYNDNQDSFLEQEKISLNFVELDMDKISETVDVSEDELLAIYEQDTERYISAEKRETRHILLSTTGAEDDTEQLAKANDLVSQLKAGADFAELAEQHSQDPGSASRGGSLGLVEHEQMVAEFEQATFSLEQDEISKPIKTQFGYHIIQVQKIQLPEQQSFADVRFELMQEERDRQAEELLLDQLNQLRNLAFEHPASLDAIVEEMQLEVLTSEQFDRNTGQGIANSALVRNTAFAEEILVDEVNSEPIEIADGQYVVIRKASYQPSEPKALASVKDQISALLTTQKATEAAQDAGEKLIENALDNWQSLSVDPTLNSTSHTVSLIDKNRVVAPEILQQVATMQLADGAASMSSVSGRNGDFYILRLTAVQAGDINSIDEQIKDSTRRILMQRNGQSLVSSYIQSLSNELAPAINTDLL